MVQICLSRIVSFVFWYVSGGVESGGGREGGRAERSECGAVCKFGGTGEGGREAEEGEEEEDDKEGHAEEE